ncbi:MAG: hypothetical protein ACRDBG_02595 [Waterburya sp.]
MNSEKIKIPSEIQLTKKQLSRIIKALKKAEGIREQTLYEDYLKLLLIVEFTYTQGTTFICKAKFPNNTPVHLFEFSSDTIKGGVTVRDGYTRSVVVHHSTSYVKPAIFLIQDCMKNIDTLRFSKDYKATD